MMKIDRPTPRRQLHGAIRHVIAKSGIDYGVTMLKPRWVAAVPRTTPRRFSLDLAGNVFFAMLATHFER
ncbi:hypothetical protein [Tardiphaga robiniae]|uniref:Uncharacterized protein n=1 Tax=Tardiphaga robiniae TaxID=943830 RepID=A0A7G6U5M7_9BRAD|nr:hypothetical protein [Tardiphaga robiniae]QND74309.1 hypothetical protein HB776_26230 [Tardiphaga robiniae]